MGVTKIVTRVVLATGGALAGYLSFAGQRFDLKEASFLRDYRVRPGRRARFYSRINDIIYFTDALAAPRILTLSDRSKSRPI